MKKSLLFTVLFFIFVTLLQAQWTTDPYNWSGATTPSPYNYTGILYRAGSYSLQKDGGNGIPESKGYLFYVNGGGGGTAALTEGGYPYYGLSLAQFDKANYSMFDGDAWCNRSLILSSWSGLCLRTKNGGMIVHQNGLISVGLTQDWRDGALIRHLSKKDDGQVFNGQHYMMYVRHGIVTEKIKVALVNNWPDYVFKKDYKLMPLAEVDTFIQAKGHLPNTLSAEVIENQGLELGATAKNHQEKIEELFLHLIALEKSVKALQLENQALKQQLLKQ
jgi:hypothetical protein